MDFNSAHELLNLCKNKNISDVMLEREILFSELTREEILLKMAHSLDIMKISGSTALEKSLETLGGLISGEANKLNQKIPNSAVCDTIKDAIAIALSVLEVNASMGVIVASPTAGSSGVLPAGILSIAKKHNFSDDKLVMALFNAAAIGLIVTKNATVSGAEGGCQAEIGTASAMTASAVTELLGGTPIQCLHSASTALANLLGLVCDPIGGLVEAPCSKRNSLGATNALICAEMSLCGLTHLIPFDEMVDVMYSVGKSIPESLRETALGGMAKAPSACSLCKF